MKKIALTIQVFGLHALFPVYVVVKLNHRTGSLPVNKSYSDIIEKTENNNLESG